MIFVWPSREKLLYSYPQEEGEETIELALEVDTLPTSQAVLLRALYDRPGRAGANAQTVAAPLHITGGTHDKPDACQKPSTFHSAGFGDCFVWVLRTHLGSHRNRSQWWPTAWPSSREMVKFLGPSSLLAISSLQYAVNMQHVQPGFPDQTQPVRPRIFKRTTSRT